MHKRERAHGSADVAWATRGLGYFSAVDFDLDRVRAGEAAEEGDFHIGDDGGGANDEAFDRDELICVCITPM